LVLKIALDNADNYGILGLKKGFEMNKIIIGFSGWVEADPEHTRFQYIGPVRESQMIIITGTEYLQLNEDERDEYILEDLGQAYTNSFDGELDVCDVRVEEDPDHVAQEFLQDLLRDKI
tara:strand:- start:382 stop:738 length:357 start_codon:yes stop_codon:yes gene_type:complete